MAGRSGGTDGSSLVLGRGSRGGTDLFGFCVAACRTGSVSTVHENEYFDASRHHCYADVARQRASRAGFPEGLALVAGPVASVEGCEGVCAAKGMACRRDWMHVANDCE